MTPRLAFALDAAVRAGRGTLAHFQTEAAVDLKADSSPVTIADREAEAYLRRAIGASYPGEAILGEEEGLTGVGDARWVIDPIDGTKSFISGVPMYGTLLSYEVDGIPILGVSYFPALDELVYAERGKGAFWNGRPCRVSQRGTVAGSVLSCGSHASMAKHGRTAGLAALAERTMATRTWTDAYGHALVATGRIEAMIDPVLAPWDISAMEVIVEEAGGAFTDFEGQPHPRNCAVSSNGLVHGELLRAFEA